MFPKIFKKIFKFCPHSIQNLKQYADGFALNRLSHIPNSPMIIQFQYELNSEHNYESKIRFDIDDLTTK